MLSPGWAWKFYDARRSSITFKFAFVYFPQIKEMEAEDLRFHFQAPSSCSAPATRIERPEVPRSWNLLHCIINHQSMRRKRRHHMVILYPRCVSTLPAPPTFPPNFNIELFDSSANCHLNCHVNLLLELFFLPTSEFLLFDQGQTEPIF